MLITDQTTGRMVEVVVQNDWLFVGYAVRLPDGTVNSFSFRTKLTTVCGELGTHNPLDTHNDKVGCEFLGCDCAYEGRSTNTPLEILRAEGGEDKLFAYLGDL